MKHILHLTAAIERIEDTRYMMFGTGCSMAPLVAEHRADREWPLGGTARFRLVLKG